MDPDINIHDIYKTYVQSYPEETAALEHFYDFILNNFEKQFFHRKNFGGHITASAMIINLNDSKVLLIEHRALGRWLQPGGHIEEDDESILNAALREVYEETNIKSQNLKLLSPTFDNQIPIDIDTHIIPARPEKEEPQHYHHDFRYLFIYHGSDAIVVNKQDAIGVKWETFKIAEKDNVFKRSITKIRHLLGPEFRPNIFFENIIKQFSPELKKYKCLVVSHILPGSLVFHQALNKIFPIITIIPKPNSVMKIIREETEKEFKLTDISRDDILKPENDLIKLLENEAGEIILFDIGGYFAEIGDKWPSSILDKIVLIVEDTENGHQKYQHHQINKIVVSVARSPLKDNEDFLVGQSVLFSADELLRRQAVLLQYQRNAVLGFGKIGKSIALHLIQRGVIPMVFDKNPIKRIEAFNGLATIPERNEIIKSADIIFSATGNRCLTINDFKKLKNGCYIVSVTSSDDEMDLTYVESEYTKDESLPFITRYSNDKNYFYLINNGNAVNFIHGAIMGDFIHLVRSEMILAVIELEKFSVEEINSVSQQLKEKIADIWLKTFNSNGKLLDFVL